MIKRITLLFLTLSSLTLSAQGVVEVSSGIFSMNLLTGAEQSIGYQFEKKGLLIGTSLYTAKTIGFGHDHSNNLPSNVLGLSNSAPLNYSDPIDQESFYDWLKEDGFLALSPTLESSFCTGIEIYTGYNLKLTNKWAFESRIGLALCYYESTEIYSNRSPINLNTPIITAYNVTLIETLNRSYLAIPVNASVAISRKTNRGLTLSGVFGFSYERNLPKATLAMVRLGVPIKAYP